MLGEYVEVMNRPKFGLDPATVVWWMELIVNRTLVIAPRVEIRFPRDRKDAKFLTCAASGDADGLLTGDGDFSAARTLISAPIMNAREFAQRYASELLKE
jgi:putative PIN family toxin of toxin-antitoxin system